MSEITRNRWKKFGYFCFSWVPMIAYLLISLGASAVVSIGIAVKGVVQGEEDLFSYIVDGTMESAMLAGAIYAAVAIVALGLWYYFGCKKKNLALPKGVLTPKNLVLFAVLAFCLQYVVAYFMGMIGAVLPGAMENYMELMEMAGVGKITWVGILYGVILGPIAEELCFRGLVLHYARRFTSRFWLANAFQAFLFGMFHMNLIQGIYAFALGILMGWIYERYHSMYANIWFHIVFNLMAFGPMEFIDGMLPDSNEFLLLWAVAMCGISVVIIRWMQTKTEEVWLEEKVE